MHVTKRVTDVCVGVNIQKNAERNIEKEKLSNDKRKISLLISNVFS